MERPNSSPHVDPVKLKAALASIKICDQVTIKIRCHKDVNERSCVNLRHGISANGEWLLGRCCTNPLAMDGSWTLHLLNISIFWPSK